MLKSEDRHLQDFHELLWNQYPNTRRLCYHVPNEATMINKTGKGVVAGVADYCIDIPNDNYHGLRLEFKLPGKTQSDRQIDYMNKIREMGFCYEIVYSTQQAIEKMKEYMSKSRHALKMGF